ncbi:MAG: hypothetical protein IMZ64_00200 [Bacteroidetes bacterium]|nr:hypothetical protein [Bacteroidota bacterium]
MNASIYCWAGEGKEILQRNGYDDRQEIDPNSVFVVAQKLFEAGLNVMVYHSEKSVILFVDTKRFTQR